MGNSKNDITAIVDIFEIEYAYRIYIYIYALLSLCVPNIIYYKKAISPQFLIIFIISIDKKQLRTKFEICKIYKRILNVYI